MFYGEIRGRRVLGRKAVERLFQVSRLRAKQSWAAGGRERTGRCTSQPGQGWARKEEGQG